MESLFDLKDGKVVLNPNSLAIPSFKKIYERDKSKKKDRALTEISYVYFLVDYKSPYSAYPEDKREKAIKTDFISIDSWEPDELILEAIDKYKEFQRTTSMRLLDGAKAASDKLTDYFNNIDFALMDDNRKPVYTAKDVAANLKSVGAIVESLEKVEDKIKKEISTSSTIIGGGTEGAYEA